MKEIVELGEAKNNMRDQNDKSVDDNREPSPSISTILSLGALFFWMIITYRNLELASERISYNNISAANMYILAVVALSVLILILCRKCSSLLIFSISTALLAYPCILYSYFDIYWKAGNSEEFTVLFIHLILIFIISLFMKIFKYKTFRWLFVELIVITLIGGLFYHSFFMGKREVAHWLIEDSLEVKNYKETGEILEQYNNYLEDDFRQNLSNEIEEGVKKAAVQRTEALEKMSESLVFVEAGEFYLPSGSVNVKLSDFYISSYEVTQALYEAVYDYEAIHRVEPLGSDYPMDNFTWYEAVEFCNDLSDMMGLEKCYTIYKDRIDPGNLSDDYDDKKYLVECDFNRNGFRLPTEVEWYFAAIGGALSKGYIYSGSDIRDDAAWHIWNLDRKPYNIVGQKVPNELGLYDMSGNVAEWCWDWYEWSDRDENPDQNVLENPKGPDKGEERVLMGQFPHMGVSLHFEDKMLEPSTRIGGITTFTHGLRIVRNGD
ncbi:MAG: formylglycine-generating enzyme family protein [bacterium]|nr:formylglycine-generating enzyme family protein [bacterium]